MDCEHTRVKPEVCDQTLGIVCVDCLEGIAVCWGDDHIPETLWNRACYFDSDAIRCEQNREDFCALCGDAIGSEDE